MPSVPVSASRKRPPNVLQRGVPVAGPCPVLCPGVCRGDGGHHLWGGKPTYGDQTHAPRSSDIPVNVARPSLACVMQTPTVDTAVVSTYTTYRGRKRLPAHPSVRTIRTIQGWVISLLCVVARTPARHAEAGRPTGRPVARRTKLHAPWPRPSQGRQQQRPAGAATAEPHWWARRPAVPPRYACLLAAVTNATSC